MSEVKKEEVKKTPEQIKQEEFKIKVDRVIERIRKIEEEEKIKLVAVLRYEQVGIVPQINVIDNPEKPKATIIKPEK